MNSKEEILRSAAASSAMEGLPLNDSQLETVKKILNGELTLQAYFAEIIVSERNEE